MYKEYPELIFIVLVVIAITIATSIVVLFIVFSSNKNKMIQTQLKADLEHQKKQNKVQLNALRSQMNPHFVHNSLNAIQYYVQKNDVETSENYLTKFSKLMRLFFDYSREQNISIKQEIELLKIYLEIEQMRFEEKLSFKIEIDTQLDLEDQQIPSMILQPIVENAVNHGLFHKSGKGLITIQFFKGNENSFTVKVIDDGIGVHKAKQLNSSIRSEKESHSTNVLEDRFKLLKESNYWDVSYSINDRLDLSGNTGTEVKLIFKKIRA